MGVLAYTGKGTVRHSSLKWCHFFNFMLKLFSKELEFSIIFGWDHNIESIMASRLPKSGFSNLETFFWYHILQIFSFDLYL